jgi:hypothetical protein
MEFFLPFAFQVPTEVRLQWMVYKYVLAWMQLGM